MAKTASGYITADIALRCEQLRKAAEKKTAEIAKDMKGDIEQHTPPPYPYRKKHMQGGWKTSVKSFHNGEYISYGVYNKNVPHLVHLVDRGHRMVTYTHRITAHKFWVTDTEDTGKFIPGTHFMDNARDKAYEELDCEIKKLVEDFNNGKQ